MAFKLLTGPYLNHLARTATTPTMSPAALTGFPVTNLYDNRASLPTYFSTGSSASTITCDLNIVPGGDFESGGDTAYWTVLNTGTVTIEANPYVGSSNLRLTPVSNDALAVQDVTVRAGEQMTITAAALSTSTNVASVLVRNRQTGKFLTSTGGWSASTGGYATGAAIITNSTSTGYGFASVNFTVESLDTCKADTVSLRIYCMNLGGGYADFDSINLWPWTNWCSVHGHNIPPFVTPTLQYSTTASTWDIASAMTLRRDSFYAALGSTATITSRYVQFFLDGYLDVGSRAYLGELVLGQSYDLIQNPNYGGSITWTERQSRLQSSIGDQWVHLHGGRPVRSLSLSFNNSSSSEYEQMWRQLWRGSRGGSNVCVIAPVEMDSEQVILGRVREALVVEKITPISRTTELEIVESPLPNVADAFSIYDAPIVEEGGG